MGYNLISCFTRKLNSISLNVCFLKNIYMLFTMLGFPLEQKRKCAVLKYHCYSGAKLF